MADNDDDRARDAGDAAADRTDESVPVVAIAASAGGLKAFRQLLGGLRPGSGMAYVLIQHLDPTHKSILGELLRKDSPLPVVEITDGMVVEPDHVYVIPPGRQLSIINRSLQFVEVSDGLERHRPADTFFESLAEDRGSQAVGVVLSGTATDGTRGCLSIKAAGGTTFAQHGDTAEYDGMPASAIAAGCVDFVLSPPEIAAELMRIARHPALRASHRMAAPEDMLVATTDQMNKLFILLRGRTGHDFSHYKPTTIKRRISKRMMVHRIDDVAHYLKQLQRDGAELDALFKDLLINVTAFFRDPEAFDALTKNILPRLVDKRPAELPVRIWVPGCSSGQEVYTLAMLVHEYLSDRSTANLAQVQLFGSDIDETSIRVARGGVYPDAYLADLSPGRRERYFRKVSGGYQVSSTLRDMCVFAVQDLIKDPPFSRLDLVSCRNLLIYFNGTLQKKVLKLLHYALQPGGYLMLGTSETTGTQSELFSTVDKKHKIYQKKSIVARVGGELVFQPGKSPAGPRTTQPQSRYEACLDPENAAERMLIDTYVPPGVIVGPDGNILRFIGRTWPYIEPAPGAASLSIYKNAHPDIVIELRAAINGAGGEGRGTRKEDVRLVVGGEERRVDINVLSLGGVVRGEHNLLVMFEPRTVVAPVAPPSAGNAGEPGDAHRELVERNSALEREITSTREYMQSIVEEQEGTNEELRSANEEIQSTNEELQSTNEELETAKEELQSANEELATVNEELETRNQETHRSNSDMQNLLASVNIPIVMLGLDLRIRQFTKPAGQLLNLIDGDIGRPIGNIKSNIELPELARLVPEVIDAMETRTLEVQDRNGLWYSVRLRPYRTLDNRIDGAVIAFIDISDVKDFERTKADLANERRLAAIVRDSKDAILLLNFDGAIDAWNPAAERIYGYSEQAALGMDIRELVPPDAQQRVTGLLEAARRGENLAPFETWRLTRDGQRLQVGVAASVLLDGQGRPAALATIESVLQTG